MGGRVEGPGNPRGDGGWRQNLCPDGRELTSCLLSAKKNMFSNGMRGGQQFFEISRGVGGYHCYPKMENPMGWGGGPILNSLLGGGMGDDPAFSI